MPASSEASRDAGAAKWIVGPPPPRWWWYILRTFQVVTLLLMLSWLTGKLGGFAMAPQWLDAKHSTNSTDALFNWHPMLMTVAWLVFMAEAIIAYRMPYYGSRPRQKLAHVVMHTCALVTVVFALVAAFQSHWLAVPRKPDLYSTHSWLGMLTVCCASLQYVAGFVSYLVPKLSLPQRKAFGPVHRFIGVSVFVMACATMMVGIQEKATFVQAFGKAPLYSATMRIPAAIQLFIVGTAVVLLYYYAQPDGDERKYDARLLGGE